MSQSQIQINHDFHRYALSHFPWHSVIFLKAFALKFYNTQFFPKSRYLFLSTNTFSILTSYPLSFLSHSLIHIKLTEFKVLLFVTRHFRIPKMQALWSSFNTQFGKIPYYFSFTKAPHSLKIPFFSFFLYKLPKMFFFFYPKKFVF